MSSNNKKQVLKFENLFYISQYIGYNHLYTINYDWH